VIERRRGSLRRADMWTVRRGGPSLFFVLALSAADD
jgi:hypothetical protein